MLQVFSAATTPQQGPPRLAALRAEFAGHGVAGFVIPRADMHQGENVAARDERLAWLTGFTGSAGFAIVLEDEAAIFVDGRYRVQVRRQVDTAHFAPVAWPATKPGPWLAERLDDRRPVGIDPWLHTAAEIDAIEKAGVTVQHLPNLVDSIWPDQPPPPDRPATVYPIEFAGVSHAEKIGRLASELIDQDQRAAVLTLPDSICWLLNIRGGDIDRTPVVQCLAILHDSGKVTLFAEGSKFDETLRAHLGDDVTIRPPEAFVPALKTLSGPVRVDKSTAPVAVSAALTEAGIEVAWGADPCILPKARKNPAELSGTTEAHLRDGAAMVEFLAWLDRTAPAGALTEIDVVRRLEEFRQATNMLRDISFDTICGAAENGAIVHYRVTEDTNRPVRPGELLLVDSGGQYLDGTTDITRTVAIGPAGTEERCCFTRVLQGMIAISRARWPRGLSGRDLDPLARAPLWTAGQDFDHGTGHGVGVFLGVHEGPQRLSRLSDVALEPGMILSNEPGYYREGAFGIRIENLVVVRDAPRIEGGDDRDQLCFETLTYVPIDLSLVAVELLGPAERDWLNAYHAEVLERIGPRVEAAALDWLISATRAI